MVARARDKRERSKTAGVRRCRGEGAVLQSIKPSPYLRSSFAVELGDERIQKEKCSHAGILRATMSRAEIR